MTDRDRKIGLQTPCLFLDWNERKRRYDATAPAVNCNYNCAVCGWNPAERDRRLTEGEWIETMDGAMKLVFKNGAVAETAT